MTFCTNKMHWLGTLATAAVAFTGACGDSGTTSQDAAVWDAAAWDAAGLDGTQGDDGALPSGATPPVFLPVGSEYPACSLVTVTEGESLDVQVEARDPDGDPVTVSVTGLPAWLSYDQTTGRLSGQAPAWADDAEQRRHQPGTFDLTFTATDGTWNVDKIVSVQVLDAQWPAMTFAEYVASRPLAEACTFHTPVSLRDVQTVTRNSAFGGGARIMEVTFGFRSQVPGVSGWQDDWVTTQSVAYLPADGPAVPNVGAVVEGTYTHDQEQFGLLEMGERACAELGIPVVVIDWDWDWGHPSDTMETYNGQAQDTRDPGSMFYPFAVSHFLRAADALGTVMADVAGWDVDLDSFQVALTGHSKFGHTAFIAAAADPDRVVGFLSSGAAGVDGNVARLLATLQGATTFSPEGHLGYLGVMSRAYTTDYIAQTWYPRNGFGIWTLGTNENRGADDDYIAKYGLLAMDRSLTVPHRVVAIPNAPHTTATPIHSLVWRMLLAHIFLGRPLSTIDDVSHAVAPNGFTVTAHVSTDASIRQVLVYYTTQSDLDTSAWNGFESVPMTETGGEYQTTIPAGATAYFVHVVDEADGVRGIVTSPPMPVDRDYPIVGLDPGAVSDLQATPEAAGLTLTWRNPKTPDLAGVVVVRKSGAIPADPLDGDAICAGLSTSCQDPGYAPNTRQGYAVFTFDAKGCYSAPTGVQP